MWWNQRVSSLSVCDAVWVPEWSPVQMYFVYFYSILATLYTVHSTSQCTVLSSALAHFANLDSVVLWGKLEKLCQFKVRNSAKQLCTFSNSSAKMHLCENVSDKILLMASTWSVMSMVIMLPILLSSFPCLPVTVACSIPTWLASWHKQNKLNVEVHSCHSARLLCTVCAWIKHRQCTAWCCVCQLTCSQSRVS